MDSTFFAGIMKRIILMVLLACPMMMLGQERIEILDSARFEVAGRLLPSELKYLSEKNDPVAFRRFLSVHWIVDNVTVDQPVLGRYKIKGQYLCFTSTSDAGSNLTFEVRLQSRGEEFRKRFKSPPQPELNPFAPQVLAHYPSAQAIPENTLLFYLKFDQPMDPDVFDLKEVKILDSLGLDRPLVWRHKVAWNEDYTVVALMLHPGRVKKDIRYLDEYGEIFYPGERVTLQLGKAFQGVNNRWAECSYAITYTITESDTLLPSIEEFQKGPVKPGSKEAVSVRFSEPMCYGSLLEGLQLTSAQGEVIQGTFQSEQEERSWSFTPDAPWEIGNYLFILPELTADLAQNQLDRPFESTNLEQMKRRQESVLLRFRVE
ncbi:hypothetical protein KFE98_18635 [bacterium SCSIO 12741]|nr:hypothetical protein KFE98_18635 [bacterium SCSIO 12741]